MPRSLLLLSVSFIVVASVAFRLVLFSPAVLDFLLSSEKSFYSSPTKSTLPWNSVSSLQQQYGESTGDLNGHEVRSLYKNTLIDDKLHTWVEQNVASSNTADERITAVSCAKMRWHARLYSRSRHNLHPFSTEYLGYRDAWVHGVHKNSWRNFVSCIAQNEDYPCPGITDVAFASEMIGDEKESDQKKKEGGWIAKTLQSCRRTNKLWNENVLKKDYNKKSSSSDGGEDL